MKNILTIFFTLFTISLSLAQTETLSAISSYPNIQPIKSSTSTHKYLVDKGNVVVTSDTLQLPFIDDFSTNRMRAYKWLENNYTDTFLNVIGTCLGNENITTQQVTLRNDTSWYYTFDTANLTLSCNLAFETILILNPVSIAAKRTFCPRRPMAKDN